MKFKLAVTAVCGFLSNLMGGWDIMLKTLIMMVIIDYITGVLSAIYNKKVSSSIGYKGIIKKICIFLIVFVAAQIDSCLGSELIRNLTIAFYISNESISVLENVGQTGVEYPQKLKDILYQLKEGDKK